MIFWYRMVLIYVSVKFWRKVVRETLAEVDHIYDVTAVEHIAVMLGILCFLYMGFVVMRES